MGQEEFFLTMIPFLMYFWEIPVGLVYSFLIATALYFANILKELFADGRPLWLAGNNLKNGKIACYPGYGQPSGHSLDSLNLLFFPLIMFVVMHKRVNPCLKAVGYIFFSVLVGLVSWSRAVVAAHFPYQIALGISFGLLNMPVSLYLLAVLWETIRGFNICEQTIAASVILIFGSFIAIGSNPTQPPDFDLWTANAKICSPHDWPYSYGSMYVALIGIGMLATFPFIICYHQAHKLQPPQHWPVLAVRCAMFVCFMCSITSVWVIGQICKKLVKVVDNDWKTVVQFQIVGIVGWTVLGLFLPMLFCRLGLLQPEKSSNQNQKPDEVDQKPDEVDRDMSIMV